MQNGIQRFKVVGNRIVIRAVEARSKTDGGIYLPDAARRRPLKGVVVWSSQGYDWTPLGVKLGDLVVYNPFAGTPYVDDDGQEYRILDAEDVLMIECK